MNLTEPIPYANGEPRPPRPERWDTERPGCAAALVFVAVILLVGAVLGVAVAWLLWRPA